MDWAQDDRWKNPTEREGSTDEKSITPSMMEFYIVIILHVNGAINNQNDSARLGLPSLWREEFADVIVRKERVAYV